MKFAIATAALLGLTKATDLKSLEEEKDDGKPIGHDDEIISQCVIINEAETKYCEY